MTENDIFDELIKSVQEMDDIVKGQSRYTRCFELSSTKKTEGED